ncbi:MAG: peptidylprolyl isomerase [Ornithinimicrobium sp.]
MLPRRLGERSLRRRCAASLLTILLVGAVSACSSDVTAEVPREPADSASPDDADRTTGARVDCSEPPPIPEEVPSFALTQAPAATAPDVAVVQLDTTCGPITLELDGVQAPQTVASFLLLTEGGFYVDSPCHRLVDGGTQVLQCGDPTGTGRGGPGYTFGIENAPSDGFYPRGTIAMARSQDPNSNGSQFFIVFGDTSLPLEGGGYTIFGKVTGGMEIVDHIADQGVDGGGIEGMPAQLISILDVRAEEETTSS